MNPVTLVIMKDGWVGSWWSSDGGRIFLGENVSVRRLK